MIVTGGRFYVCNKKIIKTAFVQEADRTLKELKEEDALRLSAEDKDAMRTKLQKMIDDSERK